LINQVINALNLQITPLPQAVSSQSGKESITSGGLSVSFTVPQGFNLNLDCPKLPAALAQLAVLCTLPSELDGFTFTFTLGRVFASAVATPGFSSLVVPSSTSPSSSAVAPTSGVFTSLYPTSASTLPFESTTSPTSPSAPLSAASSPPRKLLGIVPVSLSSPVGIGIVLALLALALLAALGLRRLPTSLRNIETSAGCPNEEEEA
jgi:hypothetical protein